ncbi:aldehyde dehydrogenase [Thermoplasma volcanium GSS1]|uniref:Aldehyde dehydrogenase n=1 Tax=Thermoplasma volcanium (strain ATCC 51530 / DSM 4299 / JCM 9571 / NBRC 15438 / GSS1) TaxID=273116 RepID=Q978V9_THEVO|nr:aldehyde dehydrogenase family protein [Thermoplasma volcanium]BAB60448.1 aldehyde dehydrogenase [Thermoplasma volcanium GSS1]
MIKTLNPYTGEVIASYNEEDKEQVIRKIKDLREYQAKWRKNIGERIEVIKAAKKNFETQIDDLSKLMSLEMGKPISQSISEVKKSIWLMDYVIENAEKFLAIEDVKTEARKSYVRFDPIGVILIIMPWNFPVWQVMRAAIPALAAGNTVILKHASIVSGTSLKIQDLLNTDAFRSVITSGETASSVIPEVDGVSFTGSTSTGSRIAEIAGKNIKKFVMELGGSDPFIVLDDYNLEDTVKNAVFGRLQNNGQSCIASKRFIVNRKIGEKFVEMLKDEFSRVKIGDPLNSDTFLGPLSSQDQKETVLRQVSDLKGKSELVIGGDYQGNIVMPTIIKTDVRYNEEIFGPVAVVKYFDKPEEAVEISNETPFGLGASIWGNPDEAEKLIPEIQAGMVFVNKIVASDPRLPFGGVKKSGVGRELSRYGMLEFTNIKTVWIN